MSDAITRPLAALMAGLHPKWDIPGCAAAIHKARNLEIGRASWWERV